MLVTFVMYRRCVYTIPWFTHTVVIVPMVYMGFIIWYDYVEVSEGDGIAYGVCDKYMVMGCVMMGLALCHIVGWGSAISHGMVSLLHLATEKNILNLQLGPPLLVGCRQIPQFASHILS